MPTVLLTSFEPFGGHARNSSLEVGRALARRPPPGVELDWLVLPVVARACVARAWARVAETSPDLVLALGQAAGAAALRVEDRAVNVDDFPQPDNAGNQPRKQWIEPGAPGAYTTTLRPDRVAAAVRAAGVPAERSFHAGTYVCNHLFYGLLHRAAVTGRRHRTGLLHLPLLPGQAPAGSRWPEVALERLTLGVRWAVRACVEAPEAVSRI